MKIEIMKSDVGGEKEIIQLSNDLIPEIWGLISFSGNYEMLIIEPRDKTEYRKAIKIVDKYI